MENPCDRRDNVIYNVVMQNDLTAECSNWPIRIKDW